MACTAACIVMLWCACGILGALAASVDTPGSRPLARPYLDKKNCSHGDRRMSGVTAECERPIDRMLGVYARFGVFGLAGTGRLSPALALNATPARPL